MTKPFHVLLLFVLLFAIKTSGSTLSGYKYVIVDDRQAWMDANEDARKAFSLAVSKFFAEAHKRNLEACLGSSYLQGEIYIAKQPHPLKLACIPSWTFNKQPGLLGKKYEVTATLHFFNMQQEQVAVYSHRINKRNWVDALQDAFENTFTQFLDAHPGFNEADLKHYSGTDNPITKEQFLSLIERGRSHPLEGVWQTLGYPTYYEIGVQFDKASETPLMFWVLDGPEIEKGRLKMMFKESAKERIWVGFASIDGVEATTAELAILNDHELDVSINDPKGKFQISFIKVFPIESNRPEESSADAELPALPEKINVEAPENGPAESSITATGSGFLVNTEAGILATNYHVAGDADQVMVLFPVLEEVYRGSVIVADSANDLALIKLQGFEQSMLSGKPLPYRFPSKSKPKIGQDVFTIGFPLVGNLGRRPKFTNGSISNVFGLNDDPRFLQISVPIQPGNSGGPLITKDGDLIGIIVATIDSIQVLAESGAIPQNINFSVKAEYLGVLLAAEGYDFTGRAPDGEVDVESIAKFCSLIVTIKN